MKHFSKKQFFGCILILLIIGFLLIGFGHDLSITEKVIERYTGPMHLRLLFQPLVASFLGIRDGVKDVKMNIPPYIFEMIINPKIRKEKLLAGLHSILTPLIIGIILDGIVQYMIFESINFKGAIIVGIVLVGLPYAIVRGITNRIMSNRIEKA